LKKIEESVKVVAKAEHENEKASLKKQISSLQEEVKNTKNPRITINGSVPILISDSNETYDW